MTVTNQLQTKQSQTQVQLFVADRNGLSLPPTVLAANGVLLTVPALNYIFRGEPLGEPLPEAAWFPANCESLTFSLHTSSPIEGNNIACVIYGQNKSEILHPGYRRARVARDADNWIVSTGRVATKYPIAFEPFGNQVDPITHLGIGVTEASQQVLLFSVWLKQPFVISETAELHFPPGSLVLTNPPPWEWNEDARLLGNSLRSDPRDELMHIQVGPVEVEWSGRFGNRHNFSPGIKYKGRDGRKR